MFRSPYSPFFNSGLLLQRRGSLPTDGDLQSIEVDSAFLRTIPSPKPAPSSHLPAVPPRTSRVAQVARSNSVLTSSTVSTGYRRTKRSDALAALEGRGPLESVAESSVQPSNTWTFGAFGTFVGSGSAKSNFMNMTDDEDSCDEDDDDNDHVLNVKQTLLVIPDAASDADEDSSSSSDDDNESCSSMASFVDLRDILMPPSSPAPSSVFVSSPPPSFFNFPSVPRPAIPTSRASFDSYWDLCTYTDDNSKTKSSSWGGSSRSSSSTRKSASHSHSQSLSPTSNGPYLGRSSRHPLKSFIDLGDLPALPSRSKEKKSHSASPRPQQRQSRTSPTRRNGHGKSFFEIASIL